MKTPHSTETSLRLNRLLAGGFWSQSIGCWLTLVALLAWNPTRTLAQQPAFLTDGLVAYYPFNGNANDESGNNNNLTGTLKIGPDRAGTGKAGVFLSPGDVLTGTLKDREAFNQNFTTAFWVKWNSGNPWYQSVFEFRSKNIPEQEAMIFQRTGLAPNNKPNYVVRYWTPAVEAIEDVLWKGDLDIADQQWIHFVVLKSDLCKVFQNGKLVFTSGSYPQRSDLSSGVFTIGGSGQTPPKTGWFNPDNEVTNGSVDEFRIYNRALSDAEVAALYAYESAPPVPAVVMAPADQMLVAGQTLSLSAQISGSNLAYRWQKNGADLADGGRVSGATTPTLTITGVTPADAGQYRLTASNANGSATTAAATVNVIPAADGWRYQRRISLSNVGNAAAVTDVQFRVIVDTATPIGAGKMNASGNDIRFVDANRNELPHWVQSGLNTELTVLWVRVDQIPANSSRDIFLVYGNGSAQNTSSGARTFPFFDDFSGDLSQWTVRGGASAKLSGGKLLLSVSSPDVYTTLTSTQKFPPGYASHFTETRKNGGRYHFYKGFGDNTDRGRLSGGYWPPNCVAVGYGHDGSVGVLGASLAEADVNFPVP